MKYDVRQLGLISNEEIAAGIFDMKLAYGENKIPVVCGQFAHVYVPGKSLRRPISVCDARNGVLRLVYQVKGEGTRIMSQMKPGASVDVLAPLGNGFRIQSGRRYALIGGGIGVPPMLYTAAKCEDPLVITGFRDASLVILQDDFRRAGAEPLLCTDNGSVGKKGFVTGLLREKMEQVDEICACGPLPMLRAIAELCKEFGKPCQVSLEERMACGVGACLVCAVRVQKNGEELMQHVCKNGPVFNAEEVVWNG
ncbi:MAG: dihydroorotate dehydrogenase electron transfer subunit [Ruminococcus sp.]|nr:dihydroorotate dehydrogenase electron transfer subunit [Ruminococcus sp.]